MAFAGLGSQDPGAITIADAVLDSKPLIMMVVLAKAFQLDVLGFSKEGFLLIMIIINNKFEEGNISIPPQV